MADEIQLEFDEEEDSMIITLEDEEGAEHEFEIIDTVEYHGNDYYALMPISEAEAEDLDGELVILKAEEQDGDDFLAIIEDDDEYAEVIDLFMKRLTEAFDGEFIEVEVNETEEIE